MNTDSAPTASDCELISARVLNFAPACVFAAWADPTRLARWWGPAGFTNTFYEFEFKAGGKWRFDMRGPDGKTYPNESRFVEIIPSERIVLDHVVAPLFRMTATFDDLGEKTHLTWRMRFETAAVCQSLKAICVPANEQNFDRLTVELSQSQ